MNVKKLTKLNPIYGGLFLFIVAQILILLFASRIDPFLEEKNIYIPSQPSETISWWPGEETLPSGEVVEVPAHSSLGPVVIYFLAAAAVIGLTLSLIPIIALRIVFRLLFASLFAWGTFIAAVFYLPLPLAIAMAAMMGIFWFFLPLIWLHDLALLLALSSLGAIFGYFITPWTVMIIIMLIAIYDFLAVRFGFMIWMADKLSQVNALPALIIPRNFSDWNLDLKRHGNRVVETDTTKREYSILGGGDIAFPGLLTASVYFSQGLAPGATIALFGLLGLVGAYVIQGVFMKGKPVPALPPIGAITLVGLFIIL
ncbi:MAG: presenilin family intramembrane aspartyl protease [Chloroflexota bacterium]